MLKAYGYIGNPKLSLLRNAMIMMGIMPLHDYYERPINQAFHDLTVTKTPHPNLRSLLGLGLKFIPTPFKTTPFSHLQLPGMGFAHLERSLRLRCFHCATGEPVPDPDYNPKLHTPSLFEPPDKLFPQILKRRLRDFEIKLYQLFRPKKTIPNITRQHRYTLEYLRSQTEFIVANCDKNLGIALIERDRYIKLCIRDHLSDTNTYTRFTYEEAMEYAKESKSLLQQWLYSNKVEITTQAWLFIDDYGKTVEDQLPYLYLTMKVHKDPLKTRPIVSFPGSTFHALGIWVDTQLQEVAKSFPTYLDSSYELLEMLRNITLPPGSFLFTADATSMYTNIKTDEAINALEEYLTNNQSRFPTLSTLR